MRVHAISVIILDMMKREALDKEMIIRVVQMGATLSDEYYLDTETGEIILVPEDVLSAVENDETDRLRPSQKALAEKAAEICSGNGRFVPIPHLSDSDMFAVVSRLAEKVNDPEISQAITEATASGDFADKFDTICISRPEVMEMFYEILDEYTSQLIDKWLRGLGVIFRTRP